MTDQSTTERIAEVADWLKSGVYLPDFMRDFHDQKDLFKTIHELVHQNEGTQRISWVDAHIYTVDVFLWFMARRGYTLQRNRTKLNFLDIRQTVAYQTKRRDEAATAALAAMMNSASHHKEDKA